MSSDPEHDHESLETADRAPLRVTLVQQPASLEPAENRAALATHTPDDVDLVVFPEAWARDFGEAGSDVAPFAETREGAFAAEVARVATEHRTTVVAGMFERSDDPQRPFNTLVAHGPDGAPLAGYRKVHLYDSFGYRESDRLRAGPVEPTVISVGGWQVGLMTCYDLRFPELSRLLVQAGAEVLVVPAAWVAGERKVTHWTTLARARAIENTCFVVAVGQPAPRYTGHSTVVDPLGDVLVEAGPEPAVLRAELDPEILLTARRTNPSLANRRL
ncbi:carbon-nitrogen hydrolase family protein [Nocardioides nanhaiensis]|uniref:Carbon-nitrogen hydrolase family protein n=1 Tax=Nocardioides nanhaiensis TaxID=1476871 RepID=A0ABP8WD19_9ACTN